MTIQYLREPSNVPSYNVWMVGLGSILEDLGDIV